MSLIGLQTLRKRILPRLFILFKTSLKRFWEGSEKRFFSDGFLWDAFLSDAFFRWWLKINFYREIFFSLDFTRLPQSDLHLGFSSMQVSRFFFFPVGSQSQQVPVPKSGFVFQIIWAVEGVFTHCIWSARTSRPSKMGEINASWKRKTHSRKMYDAFSGKANGKFPSFACNGILTLPHAIHFSCSVRNKRKG